MIRNLETPLRSTISHTALSASVALSWTAMPDIAVAQQETIPLGPIDVQAQGGWGTGPAFGGPFNPSYNIPLASSPKITAPLLNLPQTVTVIPRPIIDQQGARNLTEVLRATPGISFDAGENGFATSTNNFKIRGFDSSGNIFFDNSRDSGAYARDIFNVERVEVFKGAAADNGRGGAGGYVNLVTKTPYLQNFFASDASYGWDQYRSEDRKRATVDFNHVFAPNAAFRMNAMIEDSGVPGRDIAENKPWGIAPSVAFGLGTQFRSIFAYEHVERHDLPDWGVPGAMIPGLNTYDPTTAGARRDSFFGLKTDQDNVVSDSVLARFEYDFAPGYTLSNQTRWAKVDRFARYTIPTGYVPATQMVTTQTQFYDRVNTSITNITNLSAEFLTGTFRHTVATGVEVTREESNALRYGTLNPGNTPLLNPNSVRSLNTFMSPTEANDVNIDTIAGYFYDTVKLNNYWQVTGGVRAEQYKVDIGSTTVPGGAPIPPNGYTDTQTSLGGKIGVVYKPVEEGSIYVAYSTSNQSPGSSFLSNPDISRVGENAFPGFVPNADPIRLHNYETGVKWDFFQKRLSTAVAVFRTEKTNVPWVGRDVGETVDSLKGYGEQIVQGVEISAAGYITETWQVFGGILFMKSERRQSQYLDEIRKRGNSGAGDYGTVVSTNGDELAFTPRVSGNVWTTYKITPTDWTIGGGAQYVGSSYLGRPDDALRVIPNGRFGKLPGYFLVHTMVAYDVSKNTQLRFNIDNIMDETVAISTNWAGSRATLGVPRTYRVSAHFKF